MNKIIIGIVVLSICFSHNIHAEPVEVIPPQNKTLVTNNGRFVFGQISGMKRDQYMLDTQTGRLWQIVQSIDESVTLQIVPYKHIDGNVSVVPEDVENARVSMKQAAGQEKKAKPLKLRPVNKN